MACWSVAVTQGPDSWRFAARPHHILLKGIIMFRVSPSSPPLPLSFFRLKALLSRIPVRLYQRGWECAGLIEAENEITHHYFAVFHRDKDGPRAAAADTDISCCCRLQPSLKTGTPVDKLHANIAAFAFIQDYSHTNMKPLFF